MTNEEIINELSGKTVLEINELVKALEEAWGVSAAAAVAVAAPGAGAAAAVLPHVIPDDKVTDHHRAVETAQKIAQQQQNEP